MKMVHYIYLSRHNLHVHVVKLAVINFKESQAVCNSQIFWTDTEDGSKINNYNNYYMY